MQPIGYTIRMLVANPIYVALDMADGFRARQMADELRGYVGGLKIGLTCWHANGPAVISHVVAGFDWFLDLKWKDIPTQVAGAIRAVMPLRPTFISIHEDGGTAMMTAAASAIRQEASIGLPKLLAVTTLTSLPANTIEVCAQAQHAISCGLDGVISSPHEVRDLRRHLGPTPILMTPGIRPQGFQSADHERTATPKEVIDAGGNYIVVGRPITEAAQPRDAAKAIWDSLR